MAAPPPLVMTKTAIPPTIAANKEAGKNKEARLHFPCKVYEMLEAADERDLKHIVSWNKDGTGFTVHNKELFTDQIIPQYFNQTKYKSFQRQLSLYGFQRITNGENKGLRFHEKLRRGMRDLCRSMKPIGYKPRSSENRGVFAPNKISTPSPIPLAHPGAMLEKQQQFPAVVSVGEFSADDDSHKDATGESTEIRPVAFTSDAFPHKMPSPTEMGIFEGKTFYLMDSQNPNADTTTSIPKASISSTLHPVAVDGQMKKAWEIGFAVAMTMKKPTTIPVSTMEVAAIAPDLDALDIHNLSV